MSHIKGKYPEIKQWRHIKGVSADLGSIVPSPVYWMSPTEMKLYPEPKSSKETIVPIPYKGPDAAFMRFIEVLNRARADMILMSSHPA